LSLYLFTVIELIVAFLTALVIASWLIVRERRARRSRENFERLVLLENQTLRDDLIAIRDEFTSVRLTADSAKQSVARVGPAVLDALTEIGSRIEKLNGRMQDQNCPNGDDHQSKARASEIANIRSTMDRLANNQKIAEERLADEIRFNLDRARLIDALLKGFGSSMEGLSERLDELMRDLKLPNSGSSSNDSLASHSDHPDIVRAAPQVAKEDNHLTRPPELPSDRNDLPSAVRPSDKAA
jgi:methyl-accepting chemotaxis protein